MVHFMEEIVGRKFRFCFCDLLHKNLNGIVLEGVAQVESTLRISSDDKSLMFYLAASIPLFRGMQSVRIRISLIDIQTSENDVMVSINEVHISKRDGSDGVWGSVSDFMLL